MHKPSDNESSAETVPALNPELQRLCAEHRVGIELVASSRGFDELVDRLLEESGQSARAWDVGATGSPGRLTAPQSTSLRELIRFAHRATALQERATIAAELQRLSGELERVKHARDGCREHQRVQKVAETMASMGALCHKINNPLTSVLGRAQILRMKCGSDPQIDKAAQVIEEAATRLADGIRELAITVRAAREETKVWLEELERPGPRDSGQRRPSGDGAG